MKWMMWKMIAPSISPDASVERQLLLKRWISKMVVVKVAAMWILVVVGVVVMSWL